MFPMNKNGEVVSPDDEPTAVGLFKEAGCEFVEGLKRQTECQTCSPTVPTDPEEQRRS